MNATTIKTIEKKIAELEHEIDCLHDNGYHSEAEQKSAKVRDLYASLPPEHGCAPREKPDWAKKLLGEIGLISDNF